MPNLFFVLMMLCAICAFITDNILFKRNDWWLAGVIIFGFLGWVAV